MWWEDAGLMLWERSLSAIRLLGYFIALAERSHIEVLSHIGERSHIDY